MPMVRLNPIELCRLSLGDDREIARIAGVTRAQTVQRWAGIPSKHMPKLIEASRARGRFPLTGDMLVIGGFVQVAAAADVAEQVAAE